MNFSGRKLIYSSSLLVLNQKCQIHFPFQFFASWVVVITRSRKSYLQRSKLTVFGICLPWMLTGMSSLQVGRLRGSRRLCTPHSVYFRLVGCSTILKLSLNWIGLNSGRLQVSISIRQKPPNGLSAHIARTFP